MTTVLSPKREGQLATTLWPQVDLLPREVRQARKLKTTKRYLFLAVLVAVLLAVLGWVYALFSLNDAKQDLADAQDENTRLLAEQQQYTEVPLVKGQLSDTEDALTQATLTEVLWREKIEALRAVTPPGVSYDAMQATMSADPSSNVSTDPLQGPSLGQIVFTAQSSTLPDLASWMDAVAALPGMSDPWFTQAVITDDNGRIYYQISGTVQITDGALAHRFGGEPANADTVTDGGE